jgi:hypothetical protein
MVSTSEIRQPPPGRFEKGRAKSGGRAKGVGNFFSLNIRESILTALSNCGGERGLVGFIEQAVQEDTSYGIRLLVALAPRMADINISRAAPEIRTVEELDEQLRKLNLPPMKTIYNLDFKGSIESIEDDAVEANPAEVVVAEKAAKKY